MSGFPWYLVFVLAAFGGYYWWGRRRLAGAVASNADKNVSAVAARLGLQVIEGDGGVNLLYFQQPRGDFSRTISARGQPYGRPVQLTIMDGQKTSEFIVARKIMSSFGCFLEVELQVDVPAFEVALRQPNPYLVPNLEFTERLELQDAPTGHGALDALFRVRAADVRVAPTLSAALQLLSTQLCVHLAGEGRRIWMSFPRFGLAYFGSAPEEYLLALESAACGLEGRAAPAAVGGPLPVALPSHLHA